jgi:N-acetylglucosamine-6-sulfatase
LAVAALSALVAPGPARAADPPAKPNVVFILIDDLRWNALACTGHPFVKTPNIDRIAREGVTFRNAFVATPLCSPSRASFLTGRYAHAHGVQGNGNNNALSHTLVTFPRLLHDSGYETAYVGKWHMGTDDSPRPGFDRWVSFRGQGAHVDPAINEDGKSHEVNGYMTDILTERALEFLRRDRNKPFALYFAHKAVHGPFIPADRHKDLYTDNRIDPPPSADDDYSGKPVLRRKIDLPPAKAKAQAKKAQAKKAQAQEPGHSGIARNQLRMLAAIDESVGQVFRALQDTGHLDDTLIIFTSDNGYFWGDHGLGDKRAAYEPSIRIPMLLRYPRLAKPGTVIDQPVLSLDIAPTLLELAGVTAPAGLHGRSLVPLLRGETAGWRKAFLTEYFAEAGYPRIPTWQAVRDDRWKYIHYTDLDGMDELYDLRADPHEMKNLIDDPSARATLNGLKAELDRLLKESTASAAR